MKPSQEKIINTIVAKVKKGVLPLAFGVKELANSLSISEGIAKSLLDNWKPQKGIYPIRSFHQLVLSKEEPLKDDEDDTDGGEKDNPDIDLSLLEDDSPEAGGGGDLGEEGDGFDDDFSFDEEDLEPGLADDVNELDVFEGESTAKVTESELLDAIKAIDKVTQAMLEEAGEGDGSGISEGDLESVKDYVSHLADFQASEPSEADVPDIPTELDQSYIHVLAVGQEPSQRFAVPKLSSQNLSGVGLVEIISDVSWPSCQGLLNEGSPDGEYGGTVVVSSVSRITRSDKIQSRYLKLQSGWKSQSKENLEAWCYGLKVFSGMHGGMMPKDAKDWGSIQLLAQAYKAKHFTRPSSIRSSITFGDMGVLRRLFIASKKFFGKFQPKPKVTSSQGGKNQKLEELLTTIRSNIVERNKHAAGPEGGLKAGEDGGEIGDTSGPADIKDKVEFGGKGMTPAQVSADDQATSITYNLTGDSDSLIADTSAKERGVESPNYNFKSAESSALELPIEKESMSEVIVFKSIGNGVHILDEAYHVPGGLRCSWIRGKDSIKVLLNGAVKTQAMVHMFKEPLVIPLRSGGTAVMVKSSPVLGLIAIEAPFARGMKNAKYELFSLYKGMLVSSTGMALKNPSTEMLIASAASNKGIRQSYFSKDLFRDVERKFLIAQRMEIIHANKYAKALKDKALAQQKKAQEVISSLQQQLAAEKEKSAKNLNKVTSSLSQLKKVADVDDIGYLEQENQRFIASAKQEFGATANENVSFLSKLM
jgi:hypothetical protein